MKLKGVGFFKELRHGDENGALLKEAIRNSPLDNENEIVGYLDRGVVFCVTAELVFDVIDKSKGIIGSLEILTDGVWAWPSDLSYYIKNYHIKLDTEFTEHIKKKNWFVPDEKNVDLLNLAL